jgi:hypothetical protein
MMKKVAFTWSGKVVERRQAGTQRWSSQQGGYGLRDGWVLPLRALPNRRDRFIAHTVIGGSPSVPQVHRSGHTTKCQVFSLTWCFANTWRMPGVTCGWGPSSMVSATTFERMSTLNITCEG